MKKINYEQDLNAEQLRVVREAEGPSLVLAGAGSGKTRTITYRVAWLLEHGVKSENILLLTFTNKAAAEMLRRVGELVGAEVAGIWGGTFHSVANRILRVYAARLGYQPNFSILDQEDSRRLLKLCLKESGLEARRRPPSPAVLQNLISFSRNAREPLEKLLNSRYSQFQVFASEITALAAEYAAHKKRANAVDFDDLLANLDELLVGHPEVAERLSSQFRYILVDEYQDTNPVQAAIVDRLAAVHKNILVVGDDAQSIYSFRAATVENILSFPRRFPGARVFRLETNYRSAPEILELANEVIAKNERQFSKTLRPSAPSAGKPELIAAASSSAEAVFVAETMRRLVAGGLAANRLAALFRATHHSQELEFELSKRGIAYDYRGGMKFFERAHIKDAAAFLRLRANPRDTVSWLRTLPLVSGIGETGAARLAERLKTLENLENIDDALVQGILTGRGAEGWREYREILRRLALAASPEAAVRAILSSTYADYLELEYPDAAERLEDLEQLAIFAGGYRDLESFLAEITLKDDYDAANGARGEKKEERVVLSTIHQAKGLEWDAVFLIHLAAGNFPHVRAVGEDELEEERRLFYVALTRAKRNLYLSYPLRAGTDSWEWSGPSPFLQELDHRLVQESRRSGAGTDEGTNFSEEDTIELDELGERKRPRRGLLRDISDL